MIVDSSALIAILTDEPERAAMVEAVLSLHSGPFSSDLARVRMVVDARTTLSSPGGSTTPSGRSIDLVPVTPRTP